MVCIFALIPMSVSDNANTNDSSHSLVVFFCYLLALLRCQGYIQCEHPNAVVDENPGVVHLQVPRVSPGPPGEGASFSRNRNKNHQTVRVLQL